MIRKAYKQPASYNASDELSQLRNIGKAMRADFELLGIRSVKQLAKCDADKLYARIQSLTDSRHDPCVWDTYAAAIHQAKTGEALAWWEFTKLRKNRPLTLPSAIAPSIALPPASMPLVRGSAASQSSPGTGRGLEKRKWSASATPNPAVAAKFNSYPGDIRTKLLSLRELILEVAATTNGVGALEETLKWGQVSYLTSQTGSGSLIRLDQNHSSASEYALYFHCQTTLVDTFRELFPQQFRFDGNRALVFDVRKTIPAKQLRHCIELALTYHLNKKTAKQRRTR